MSVLRGIQGVRRLDRIKSEEIRQQLGQEDILDVIRKAGELEVQIR